MRTKIFKLNTKYDIQALDKERLQHTLRVPYIALSGKSYLLRKRQSLTYATALLLQVLFSQCSYSKETFSLFGI